MPSLMLDIAANIASLQRDMASAQKTISSFAREAESAFSKLGAAAAFAGVSIGVKQLIEAGAKAMQAEESFAQVAKGMGESADKIVAGMKRASAGTVDESDIMQKAVKGMVLGLSGDQLVGIMEAARVSARVAGEDVKTAYEKITDAIATGMPKALRQYGLVSKEEAAIVDQALKAGVQGIDLYRIAMTNAEIQAAKFGEIHANAAERLQVFKATVQDVTESLGKMSVGVQSYFLAGMYGIDAAIVNAAASLAKLIGQTDAYDDLTGLANDLTKTRNGLLGIQTEEEKKASAAAAEGAKGKIAAAQANKEAYLADIKAQTEAAENAKKIATEAAENAKKTAKEQEKAMADLISITAKFGKAQLTISSAAFSESLKAENATIEQLETGLDAYLTTLQSVYTARIEGEKAIAAAISATGGEPTEVAKAQLAALEQEEKYYVDRLAGQQKYYESLQSLHATAITAMKKKTGELQALEEAISLQRVAYASVQTELTKKLLVAKGKALTDESIYSLKLQSIEEARAAANKLSGDAQVKALEKVQKEYGDLTQEVTAHNKVFDLQAWAWVESNKTVITQEEAIKKAIENVASVQKDITAAQDATKASKEAEIATNQTWISELEASMALAKTQAEGYKAVIDALSVAIANMEREIAISVIDNATAPIKAIKAELDKLQDKIVNVTVNQQSSGGSGQASASKVHFDAATGSYIDEDGYTVGYASQPYGSTAGQNSAGYYSVGSSSSSINDHSGGYGGGTYTIPDPGQSTMYDDNGDLIGYGKGAAFRAGNVIPFAYGGIFDKPTLFPMAKGMGLMGEAGAEAVMPLMRGPDGKLGVRSAGGGQVFNIASGAIVVQGATKSSKELAREIVRDLQDEMRRLKAVV